LLVETPDQLRKIGFGLEKFCNNDGTESWIIHFELDEATTAGGTFIQVVKLDIGVNPENHDVTAATVASGSLDDNQTSGVLAAGDTAKALSQGQATEEDVKGDANDALAARGSS